MNDSQKVTVYVRLCGDGNDSCRELSFRIPEGISQADLLDQGFAIDGNSAMQSVYAVNDMTLGDALLFAQRHLVAWLAERGYEVQFS